MGLIAMLLYGIGLLIAMVGAIWIVVIAFQESVLWGLGCFFIPCVALYYVITHWEKTKKPFLIEVVGGVICAIGSALVTQGGGN
jgi:hypothetical protein